MRRFLAVLLCAGLWAQPVLASDIGAYTAQEEVMQEEDAKEDTEEATQGNTEEGEATGEAEGGGIDVSAPSAILMVASTGQVIYEKDPDSVRPPASVTKVMTLLLIFDALKEGKITLEEEVATSEYAASMGGSQVFLEPGEVQTVDTMIKCISVASANDACVAMAEHICGDEGEFVAQMNAKAKELGMENTNFVNCNGLDTDGHVTTARDIALMSRELILKHPEIRDYCMIWMENITHVTRRGTSEFGLTNTNKLIRQYEYATGLKTGSTSLAKFCLSATAEKNGMEMIAVVMAAEDSKARVRDATALLNYGFGKCRIYKEDKAQETGLVAVRRSVEKRIHTKQEELFSYVDVAGADFSDIERKVTMKKKIEAPVKEGDKVGEAIYSLGGEEIGRVDIVAAEQAEKTTYKSTWKDVIEKILL